MNAKLMIIAFAAAAFCMIAFVPMEESDAASYNAQSLYNGGSTTITYQSATSVTISDVDLGGGQGYFASDNSFSLSSGQSKTVTIEAYYDDEYQGSVTIVFSVTTPPPTTYYFTIKYWANGGSGAPSDTTASGSSSTKSITLSSTTPSRTNYSFLGWSTSSTASSASYQPGYSYTFSNGTTNLYAVWQYNAPTYTATLQYNANGGSGAPSSQTYTSSSTSTHTFTIPSTVPTRTDYIFMGWSESSSATTASYQPGGSVGVAYNATKTLYAVWRATYTLTFASNDNTYGTVSPASLTVPAYSKIRVSDNTLDIEYPFSANSWTVTATPAAADASYVYSFSSWSVQDDPDGVDVTSAMSITATFTRAVPPPSSYTLTFVSNDNTYGTVSPSTLTVPPYAKIRVSDNVLDVENPSGPESWTVTATPAASDGTYAYSFTSWSVLDDPDGVDVTSDMTITATFTRAEIPPSSYTLTFMSNDINMGTVSPSSLIVPAYAKIRVSQNTLDIEDPNGPDSWTVTASYIAPYSFTAWSVATDPDGVDVTSDMTITAYFGLAPTPDVYWSNDNYNGSVTITYRFTGGSSNLTHNMSYGLISNITSNSQTTWNDSGYAVNISISYYPRTVITCELTQNGQPVQGATTTTNLGQWPVFNLTLNADTSTVVFTPVDRFTNFTNFTTLEGQSQTIFGYAEITERNAIREITHTDSGNGAHVNFSVTDTSVFLNTYGVVLYNPSINPFNYFPEYQSLRLDFRSFAIYGDSFTVNGTTFPVVGGNTTVWYTVDTERNNHIASEGTEGALQKTLPLSNIQVTWDDGKASLTFVNDRFTVDLGEYSAGTETISFQGYWYFTTTLHEPYTVTERSISGDWKSVPDIGTSAILLIFLGILLAGGLIAHVKLGLKWLDVIIVLCSMIFVYALLG